MNKTAIAALAVVVALLSGLLLLKASLMIEPEVEETYIPPAPTSGSAAVEAETTVGAETSVNIANSTVETSVRIAE